MNDKSPSKADGLRAMREANYAANHSRGAGRSANPSSTPSGLQHGADTNSDPRTRMGTVNVAKPQLASRESNPVAKATEAKPSGLDAKGPSKTPVTPADRVASRLGAGRTAQDSPRLETAEAVATLKRGRPKIEGPKPWELAGMSKRTWYRRQKES